MSQALAKLLLLLSPLLLLELKRAIPVFLGLSTYAPDPLIVAVGFAALRACRLRACIFAAACGLLLDVPAGTHFGLSALRLSFFAAVLASVRHELDAESPVVCALVVLLLALGEKVLEAMVLETCMTHVALFPLLFQAGVIALATAALTPFLWPACDALLLTARGGDGAKKTLSRSAA